MGVMGDEQTITLGSEHNRDGASLSAEYASSSKLSDERVRITGAKTSR